MKSRIATVVLIGLLGVMPALGHEEADSAKSSNWCTLGDAWFVYPVQTSIGTIGPYTLISSMTSPHRGAVSIVWSGFDPSVFGLCPGGVVLSDGQGAVERTGPRSFDLTIITTVLDATGAVVCIGKSNLSIDLARGCESGAMNGQLELYFGDQDPFSDSPFYCFPRTDDDYLVVKVPVQQPDALCP